jgi:H+/Cl- antiporter ClcA
MTALDVVALIILAIVVVAVVALVVALAIVPGRIAQRRQHPQTEAIRVTGYLGILFAPLWIIAFIWAYTRSGTSEVESAVANMNDRITTLENSLRVGDKIHTQ